MQQIYNRLLDVAGAVVVLLVAYVSVMAAAEFIVSIPTVWLIGELLIPRKDRK